MRNKNFYDFLARWPALCYCRARMMRDAFAALEPGAGEEEIMASLKPRLHGANIRCENIENAQFSSGDYLLLAANFSECIVTRN